MSLPLCTGTLCFTCSRQLGSAKDLQWGPHRQCGYTLERRLRSASHIQSLSEEDRDVGMLPGAATKVDSTATSRGRTSRLTLQMFLCHTGAA